jgi:hypothetical protein
MSTSPTFIAARVAVRRECAGDIDEVHQAAAQQVPERIGVIGQNDLCHLRL